MNARGMERLGRLLAQRNNSLQSVSNIRDFIILKNYGNYSIINCNDEIVSLSIDAGNLSNFPISNIYKFFCCGSQLIRDVAIKCVGLTSLEAMFYSCSNLKFVDVRFLDTTVATKMGSMFEKCSSLRTVDFSGVNTNVVTDLHSLFFECKSLESVDVSSFNVRNVTTVSSAFRLCKALKHIDLSKWDTENLENMESLFRDSAFETINLSGLKTHKVTDMRYMFAGLGKIQELDLSSFDMSSVAQANSMFAGCISLTSLRGAMKGMKVSISLQYSNLLTRESILEIFNNVADITGGAAQVITLHKEAKARLSEEDIAIATSKGWTVA